MGAGHSRKNAKPMNMNRIGEKWSTQDIEILKELVLCSTPVAEIAMKLGRCEKGVKSKAYSLGLNFSKRK